VLLHMNCSRPMDAAANPIAGPTLFRPHANPPTPWLSPSPTTWNAVRASAFRLACALHLWSSAVVAMRREGEVSAAGQIKADAKGRAAVLKERQ
jgi:hypothetical protein